MKTIAKKIYLALICIILYAPIVTLIVLSFNNTKTRSKWGGFTGKWYVSLFQNKEIMNALYTTLIIALLSALIATLIGTCAALGMQAMNSRMRTLFMGKHPYAECRYRNRSIPDASLHCIPLHTWIQNNPFGTYYIQHTLCHLKCNAKIKTDEP